MATRYTTDTFKEKLKTIFPDYEIPPEEVYKNGITKMRVICPKHGIFEAGPASLLLGHGCQKCGRERNIQSRRLTQAEFIGRVKLIFPEYGYEETKFVSTDDKVKIRCPKHGIFEIRADGILGGRGCPKCGIERIGESNKLTQDEFIGRVKLIFPEYGYNDVIYTGTHNGILVMCHKHGIFETTPNSLLQRHGCPKCGQDKATKGHILTQDEFIGRVKLIFPEYRYEETIYVSAKLKVRVGCNYKNHGIFEATPNTLLQGHGCPKCGREQTMLSQAEFIGRVKLIFPEYGYNDTIYTGSFNKVKVECKEHGAFYTRATSLLCGKGCPKCKASKGEKFVAKWLDDNGIEYTHQKKFDTCKDINHLPFDFHIKNTKLLIEYDGEQHYRQVKAWGGEEGLRYRMLHDHMKNTWARANNYIVIRLDYLMSDQERLDMLETIKRYNCLKAMTSS